jgi:hypothetical protein
MVFGPSPAAGPTLPEAEFSARGSAVSVTLRDQAVLVVHPKMRLLPAALEN